MNKKFYCFALLLINLFIFNSTEAAIHTVKITKGWCGNLAISTKVGYLKNNKCEYVKETAPYGYDGCLQELDGYTLQSLVGSGFTCAATHIQSNFNGEHGLDEFTLILDPANHYIGSNPALSTIELQK